MDNKPFRLSDRLKSFAHAFNGIIHMVKEEPNFRIHIVATAIVIIAGICLGISTAEWLIILIVIAFVLVTEIINTSVERLCDIIQPEYDKRIKNIKDILAAAVLLSAVMSVIIGIIIFLPYILALFLR